MADGFLTALFPIVLYWVGAGVYHLIASRMQEKRLFTDEEERALNLVTRRQVLMWVLLNQALQLSLTTFAINATQGRTMSAASEFSFGRLLWQMPVAMIIIDTWQYWYHRAMHESKFLYKHIHSVHHLLVVPHPYGAQLMHPVDSFFGDTVGGSMAIFATGMSPWTSAALISITTIKALDDHCALWLPYSPISRLSNNAAFHSVHHQLKGIKHNYSTFFFVIWDLLMGTYMPYSVEERKGGGYQLIMGKDE